MNKLDVLVRDSMLRWPLIMTCRWDVLRHLYMTIGNGFEWQNGELICVFADHPEYSKSEEQCIAEFFDDIDERLEDRRRWTERCPGLELDGEADWDKLDRARRQFQLSHIDLLVAEKGLASSRQVGLLDMQMIDKKYSHALTVPDDVEDSFLDGAVEVLGTYARTLYPFASVRTSPYYKIGQTIGDELRRLRRMQGDRRAA
jgi:hypothetical protein